MESSLAWMLLTILAGVCVAAYHLKRIDGHLAAMRRMMYDEWRQKFGPQIVEDD